MTSIERLFNGMPQLPSIPSVVQALIATLGDEDADLGSMVARIKQDQSLSARVLRLANSSYYGASHKIGAIDDAVTLIGLNALRTLVIASGITAAFTKIDGIDLKKFWRHAMFTAALARDLGKMAGINGEFAYTAGLMHRIGQLIIDMAFPSVAREIAYDEHDMDIAELAEAERRLLDLDHSEVGAELALRWNFPAVIRNALRWYVDPLADAACPYAGVVHLASQITQAIENDQDENVIVHGIDKTLAAKLALDDLNWKDVISMAQELLQNEVVFD